MPEEKQNGTTQSAAAVPQKLEIPEGDRFLFVRVTKEGQFQVLHSNPFDGFALLWMADEFLRAQLGFQRAAAPAPTIQIPAGMDIGSIQRRLKNNKFGNG